MSTQFNQSIPIKRRYESLVKHWGDFSKKEDSRICIWKVEPDERSMIDLFFKVEASPHGKTPDIFFKLQSTFENLSQYSQALIEELKEQVQNYAEATGDNYLPENWPQKGREEKPIEYFSVNFFSFALELNASNHVVAYLSPLEINDWSAYLAWVKGLMELNMPPKLRIMLCDGLDASTAHFHEANYAGDPRISFITPELDMSSAMKEVAVGGDLSQPGVKFQLHYIDLSEACGKGHMKRAEDLAQKCLDLAKQHDWPQLQVAVHLLLGSAWIGKSDYQEALDAYSDACTVAENMYRAHLDLGTPMYVQTLFTKASILISAQLARFQEALLLYQKAAEASETLPAADPSRYYHLMEANRLMGYCHEKLADYKTAWACYDQAIAIGANLQEPHQSTLPYVGKAMLDICPKVGNHELEDKLRAKMVNLLGPDWESMVMNKKN